MAEERNNGLPKCSTGFNPSGLCSCCRTDGRKCCIGCKDMDSCNIVCGWIPQEGESDER